MSSLRTNALVILLYLSSYYLNYDIHFIGSHPNKYS